MEKVIVKVRGEQTGADGETNAIEVVAEGRHYEKNGMHYVLYDDHMGTKQSRPSCGLSLIVCV